MSDLDLSEGIHLTSIVLRKTHGLIRDREADLASYVSELEHVLKDAKAQDMKVTIALLAAQHHSMRNTPEMWAATALGEVRSVLDRYQQHADNTKHGLTHGGSND